MSKAPSEKHLEDWFVNRHSELEYNAINEGIVPPMKLIVRQPRLPSGIADLIVQMDSSVVVVELKKGVIDAAVLAQCLRYMRDVKGIMGYALAYIRDPRVEWLTLADPEVTGILVGHKIDSTNTLIAAMAANVEVMLYDYDATENFYSFTPVYPPFVSGQIYLEYAQDGIGEAFRNAYANTARAILDDPEGYGVLKSMGKSVEAYLITQQDVYPHPVYDEIGCGEGFPTKGGEE